MPHDAPLFKRAESIRTGSRVQSKQRGQGNDINILETKITTEPHVAQTHSSNEQPIVLVVVLVLLVVEVVELLGRVEPVVFGFDLRDEISDLVTIRALFPSAIVHAGPNKTTVVSSKIYRMRTRARAHQIFFELRMIEQLFSILSCFERSTLFLNSFAPSESGESLEHSSSSFVHSGTP